MRDPNLSVNYQADAKMKDQLFGQEALSRNGSERQDLSKKTWTGVFCVQFLERWISGPGLRLCACAGSAGDWMGNKRREEANEKG